MDTFEGLQREPASLHKYTYTYSEPINRIDPSGHFVGGTAEQTMTLSIAKTISVIGFGVGMIVEGVLAHRDYINEQTGIREIETVLAGAGPNGITQADFDSLQRRVAGSAPRRRAKSLYLHYSFEDQAKSLLGGLWSNSFATKEVYPTGWDAKRALALPQRAIQDAIYVVWPRPLYEPTGPTRVQRLVDEEGRNLPGKVCSGNSNTGRVDPARFLVQS